MHCLHNSSGFRLKDCPRGRNSSSVRLALLRWHPRPICAVSALRSEDLTTIGIPASESVSVFASNPALSDPANQAVVSRSWSFLLKTYKPRQVANLVRRRPELLARTLEEWHQFLTGYGLSDEAVWKVFRYSPELFAEPAGRSSDGGAKGEEATSGGAGIGGCNSPFNAGAAIVFLKSYGWTDEEIVQRVVPCYPEVLAATPEQRQAAIEFLRSRQFDEEAIQRMVRTFPQLLAPSFNEDTFPIIDRIRKSAHNKYVVSGSYHV